MSGNSLYFIVEVSSYWEILLFSGDKFVSLQVDYNGATWNDMGNIYLFPLPIKKSSNSYENDHPIFQYLLRHITQFFSIIVVIYAEHFLIC